MNDSESKKPRCFWIHFTPDRLLVGLLAIIGVLFLVEHYSLFAFTPYSGWGVLLAIALVTLTVFGGALFFAVSVWRHRPCQFFIRSILLLMVCVGLTCGWFRAKLNQAEQERLALEELEGFHGGWSSAYCSPFFFCASLTEAWPLEMLCDEFFQRTTSFQVWGPYDDTPDGEFNDRSCLAVAGLTQLRRLDISDANMTDAGLRHLEGLTNLERLVLPDTGITEEGVERFRHALSNCEIRMGVLEPSGRLHWWLGLDDEEMEEAKKVLDETIKGWNRAIKVREIGDSQKAPR